VVSDAHEALAPPFHQKVEQLELPFGKMEKLMGFRLVRSTQSGHPSGVDRFAIGTIRERFLGDFRALQAPDLACAMDHREFRL